MSRALLLLLVPLVLSGCASGGDDVSGDEANDRLVQQRVDVRAAAHDVLGALRGGLQGSPSTTSAQYRGCESAFNDEYKNFRYLAQARVDVPEPPADGALGGAFEEAGFAEAGTRSIPGGGRSLRFTKGDLTASLTVYDGQPYVLLDVAGPCIDVPDGQRDRWLRADEPSPDLR